MGRVKHGGLGPDLKCRGMLAGIYAFVRSLTSRDQGQVKARYKRCRRPAANGVLIRGPHAEFLCVFCRMDFCYFAYAMSRGFAYVRSRRVITFRDYIAGR